jgi:hypothetical protein
MATGVSQARLELLRAVLADAALAFVATVVVGLVIASLAAAGIITMPLAYILLGLAWLVAVAGTFLVPWKIEHRHRVIFASFLVFMLAGVGWYETAHYSEPPSAKDIAQEVSKLITSSSPNKPAPAMPANPATGNSPVPDYSPNRVLQSSEGKLLFSCAIPPPENSASFPRQYNDYKSGMGALGEALDIKMSTSIINNGVRLDIEAISQEGKERIWRSTGTLITKIAIEVRRVGQNEIVSLTAERPPFPQSMLLMMPIQPSKDDIEKNERGIEKIIGAPSGVCHIF